MSDQSISQSISAQAAEQEHAQHMANSIALARANARSPRTKEKLVAGTALSIEKIGIAKFNSEEEAAAAQRKAEETGIPIQPTNIATIETVFDKATGEILSREVIEEPGEPQVMANSEKSLE